MSIGALDALRTGAMTNSRKAVVLIAVRQEQSLAGLLEDNRYAAIEVRTAALAIDWARAQRPDAVILDADLPDMSGLDVCRILQGEPGIGDQVPILILTRDKPTPMQRVDALRAGAWDFLWQQNDPQELALKLQTYLRARQNIHASVDEEAAGMPVLYDWPGLARRARELGALLTRRHGAMAAIVFRLEGGPFPRTGSIVARETRLSDVLGTLGPAEYAVLAPGTDQSGALRLARRVAKSLQDSLVTESRRESIDLCVGYDAVDNLTYAPIDPAALIARASAGSRSGTSELETPWIRRFVERPTLRSEVVFQTKEPKRTAV